MATVQDSVDPETRKLAEIVTIKALTPILKATKVVLATFCENAWQVVVNKDTYQVGEKVIYFSLDAILYPSPDVDFLGTNLRVKSRKMVNVLSQGLVGPLTWLDFFQVPDAAQLPPGTNVTQLMRVRKYVAAEEKHVYETALDNIAPQGTATTLHFPRHVVPQTDEPRIQGYVAELQQMISQPVVVTTKFDGSSCTFLYTNRIWIPAIVGETESKVQSSSAEAKTTSTVDSDGMATGTSDPSEENGAKDTMPFEFYICSRNRIVLTNKGNDKEFDNMARKYNVKAKMQELGLHLAIQGEICGPKMNGNRHGLESTQFFIFNVYDIAKSEYYAWDRVCALAARLQMLTVPTVYEGMLLPFAGYPSPADVDTPLEKDAVKTVITNLLERASKHETPTRLPAEGFVIKTAHPQSGSERFSCKVLSNTYLLKHDG